MTELHNTSCNFVEKGITYSLVSQPLSFHEQLLVAEGTDSPVKGLWLMQINGEGRKGMEKSWLRGGGQRKTRTRRGGIWAEKMAPAHWPILSWLLRCFVAVPLVNFLLPWPKRKQAKFSTTDCSVGPELSHTSLLCCPLQYRTQSLKCKT